LKQDQFAEAEELLRECLAIREEKLPESWLRFNAMSLLGGALAGQGKYEEAAVLLVEGYEGMRAKQDAPGERRGEALERVVELHDAWHSAEPGRGHDEKAAQWRGKLEAWRATTQPAEPLGTGADATTQPGEA
jgi:serine/threonine-protein kinase